MVAVCVAMTRVVASMRRVGAHLSTAGGIFKAVENVSSKGGNALQIFSSSPRMWFASPPAEADVAKFKEKCTELDVSPVVIHAKYLVNLASDNPDLQVKSVASLKHDLKVGNMIGAMGIVVHLGSHQGRGFESASEQMVQLIKSILQDSSGDTMFLIENSAGQKGKIASQLSEISLLIKAVGDSRLGWCMDTCHAFAAGYTCGEASGNSLYRNDIVGEAESLGILDKLKVLHVNDSRDEFGSGRDRHDNLGEGKMGLEVLSAFVNHPKLKHLPLITEAPGFDGMGPDERNISILKNLVG